MHRILYLILWSYLPIIGYQILWDELGAIFYTLQTGRPSLRKVMYRDQGQNVTIQRAKIQRPTLYTPSEEHLLWDSAQQLLSAGRYWGHCAEQLFVSLAELRTSQKCLTQSGAGPKPICNLGPLTVPHLLLCDGHFVWRVLQGQM